MTSRGKMDIEIQWQLDAFATENHRGLDLGFSPVTSPGIWGVYSHGYFRICSDE